MVWSSRAALVGTAVAQLTRLSVAFATGAGPEADFNTLNPALGDEMAGR